MMLLSYRCMKGILQGVGLAAWDVSGEGTAKRRPQRPLSGILLNMKKSFCCFRWPSCLMTVAMLLEPGHLDGFELPFI